LLCGGTCSPFTTLIIPHIDALVKGFQKIIFKYSLSSDMDIPSMWCIAGAGIPLITQSHEFLYRVPFGP